jgi:hypothetical protein
VSADSREGLSNERSPVGDEQREAPAVKVGEVTPGSDRGVTVTWAGIHWLTGVSLRPAEEVREALSKHMWGLTLEERPGRWTYQYQAVEQVSKAFVAWSDHQPGKPDEERLDVAISLPGEACEMLGTAGLLALARELDLRITRLDLAWDTELLTPHMVRNAHEAGYAVTHAKKSKWLEEKGGKSSGATFYLGNREANNARLLRVYDRRGPTRVELELHEQRADMMWKVLEGMDPDGWSEAGLHYLVDFVDFRDRDADVNVGRCPRLDWWESFTAGASRLALPIPRKAPDLESQEKWMKDGVSSTLAVVADSRPDATEYVLSLLQLGRLNRKPRQSAVLAVVLGVSQ